VLVTSPRGSGRGRSAALKENIAKETSPCVQNWLNAGAVIIGRTNTPEFTCRWETNNEVFGPTRNPWNPRLTPGGSSGGAAASLAVGITPLAHGTDLGGSLRQPAQACGVASIRPSLGRVPDYVPTEHEPTIGIQLMNTDGLMARRVADVRLGLKAMAVGDWRGPWWVPAVWDQPGRGDLPVALIVDPLGQGVDPQVAAGVKTAAGALLDAGHCGERAEPPTLAEAVRVWKMIVIGELFTGLEPAVGNFCSPSLKRMFERYHQVVPNWTPEHYNQAFGERRRVLRDWLKFFRSYSVIVAPVSAWSWRSMRWACLPRSCRWACVTACPRPCR
jgi:amidase